MHKVLNVACGSVYVNNLEHELADSSVTGAGLISRLWTPETRGHYEGWLPQKCNVPHEHRFILMS